MTLQTTVDEFLEQSRIAFVGASQDPKHFSRTVFREMVASGYALVPVNPEASDIDGLPAYASIAAIPGEVDAALIMTPAEATFAAVEACADRGIRHVWLHRGLGGPGAVDPAAVALCRDRGIHVVDGQCPLMFVGEPAWIHRVHAWCKRRRGTFPAAPAPTR